jgi:hypothetical protein
VGRQGSLQATTSPADTSPTAVVESYPGAWLMWLVPTSDRAQHSSDVGGAGHRSPGWPGPPEEDTRTRGVLVARPRPGAKQRATLRRSSLSMTAMGGEDDAVDSSAWLAPSVPCSAFRLEALLEQPSTSAGGFPLGPLAGAARSSLPAVYTRSGRRVAAPQALQQQLEQSPDGGESPRFQV